MFILWQRQSVLFCGGRHVPDLHGRLRDERWHVYNPLSVQEMRCWDPLRWYVRVKAVRGWQIQSGGKWCVCGLRGGYEVL